MNELALAGVAISLGLNVMFLTRELASSMKESGSIGFATASGQLCWLVCLYAVMHQLFRWFF